MPFADKVVHVTLSGEMLGGQEEWQTGFYCGLPEGPAPVPTQLFTDAVRDAWVTFFTAFTSGISMDYTFTQVKAVRLGTDGKYDGSAVATSMPATAVTGGSSGSPMPPQVALVATLIAGSGKGLAGKGRMYLPGVRFPVDGGGHLSTGQTDGIATNLAAFFNTVNGSFDVPGEVINASKGMTKFAGAGARNVPINGVRVGNVYDTQRRRRNALAETYSIRTVAD
jgi:hypothetical protein